MRGRSAGGCPRGSLPQLRAQGGFWHTTDGQRLASGAESAATSSFDAQYVPPTPAELAPHFPDLEILELVGRGGMGVVYKARQKRLDRLVALKILAPKIGQDPAFAERFAREARAMAMLSHPHIVAVYDFGQTDGLYYFLMEFVDGVNLRRLLDAGKLAPEGGPGHRAADLRRPAIRPRPRRRPPRHQAGEHPAGQERPGEDRRLRPGEAGRAREAEAT